MTTPPGGYRHSTPELPEIHVECCEDGSYLLQLPRRGSRGNVGRELDGSSGQRRPGVTVAHDTHSTTLL